MLSPREFTVGTFADAKPLSLILPRTQHEETVLFGHLNNVTMAVFLSGQNPFLSFESADNKSWMGLIVPDVSIEVDETSAFNPAAIDTPLGSVLRMDTRLAIEARTESSFRSKAITLHNDLMPAGEFSAGFKTWQVVIGEGHSKRVLWRTPDPKPAG
ncbi:hypothetical protein GCM10010520_23270 [Rhizobium viscosum]|uniref:Pyridoxamine 5'-phosphate oxidase family protein n=1 Tax=Rhizobium viscosum TaxID=1673 RepID=A0ABR9IIT0_RHIVS|nr:hypothetical protein [Rhizobium viscosum]MBE1503098.1 hypothetical protein [Rhizobium viscosum]